MSSDQLPSAAVLLREIEAARQELAGLSCRERETLVLFAKGFMADEIAKKACVSQAAIHTRMGRMREITGLSTNELLVLATRARWV